MTMDGKGVKDGNKKDRHSTGSFYTPETITRYNASKAISARVVEMAGSKERPGAIDDLIASSSVKDLKRLYYSILRPLTILDPACGDGAFLLACLEVLIDLRRRCLSALERKRSKDKMVISELRAMSRGQLGLRVLKENIYGIDIDKDAVKACRKAMLRAATEGLKKAPSSKTKRDAIADIRHGNALLGLISPPVQATLDLFQVAPSRGRSKKDQRSMDDKYLSSLITKVSKDTMDLISTSSLFHWHHEFPEVLDNGGFDVIIGNPPYGDRALSRTEREVIKAIYPYGTTMTDGKGKGSVNPSSVFIERCYGLMKEGGQMSFILPSSMTRVQEFEKTRRFLVDRTHLWHLVDEGAPFKGITLEMFSMFTRKGRPDPGTSTTVITRREGHGDKEWTVPIRVFERHDRFMLYWDPTFEKISEKAIFGGLSGKRGPTIPENRYSREEDGAHKIPLLISGKAIQRYRLVRSEFHWAQERLTDLPGAKAILDSTLLIGTRLKDHYRVCVKPPGYAVADNVIRLMLEVIPRIQFTECACMEYVKTSVIGG